jgi:6-phosphogluconolactonase
MISGSMEVTVAAYDAAAGTLKEIQSAPLTAATAGMSEGSEVQIDRAGKFVYASTRAVDASLRTSHLDGTLHVLAVDPATGKLTPVQHISSMGDTPRTFALDPSGKYLFAGNEYSGTIAIFAIDPKTGMLTPTGKILKDVPEPSCFLFEAAN